MKKKKPNNKKGFGFWKVFGILAGILLLIILVLAIIYITLNLSSILLNLKFQAAPADIVIKLEEEKPGHVCSLDINPKTAEIGTEVTGTIIDGANTMCVLYVNPNNLGWFNLLNVMTDATGVATGSYPFDFVGSFRYRAICGDCITNEVTATIIDGSVDPDTDTCTENDGGKVITVPGITYYNDVGYMDQCIATDVRYVHEYWCDGTTLKEENIMCDTGSICFATRSGSYCLALIEDTWEVGDTVDHSSGGGVMPESGGVGYEFHDLMDFEVVPGGDRRLGARISTSWDYLNPEACYGFVVQEGMEWSFADSDSVEWNVVDPVPQSHTETLCPLEWDGENLWHLDFWKTQNIQGCEVEYMWEVEIYVCE